MSRQIVLDTETTGLSTEDGHRIIEIGCVEVIDRKTTGNTFHEYINPERMIDAQALAVHGIEQSFLKEKPVFSKVADDFLSFVNGAELIIHNAPFDMGFLNYEFQLLGDAAFDLHKQCAVIDSLVLAKHAYPGSRNNLDALCARLGVNNTERELHGALLDAQILAEVYLLMTGGQVDLHLDLKKEANKDIGASFYESAKTLKTVLANEEELADHYAFMEKM